MIVEVQHNQILGYHRGVGRERNGMHVMLFLANERILSILYNSSF